MILTTQRLRIIPLNYQQLLAYLQLDNSLEKELGIVSNNRTIVPSLATAFQNRILPNVNNPNKNYLFSTLWIIVLLSENKMVGELCFKGDPDEDGAIEIGYGMYEGFKCKGIMTEAIAEITKWALSASNVKTIIANTATDNYASHKILERNCFIKGENKNEMIEWQLKKYLYISSTAI